MKKAFAPLLVLGILIAGVLGGLSVVPHVHGDDFDHSDHQSCLVHQKSQQSPDAAVDETAVYIRLHAAPVTAPEAPLISCISRIRHADPRGPPAASF